MGFEVVDKQTWKDQAVRDLQGEDFEKQLVSTAMEGFSVYPYYNAEDTADTQWIKAYDNRVNPTSGTSPRHWVNAVEVSGKDEMTINAEIRLVLNKGADGLILPLSRPLDFQQVFKDVVVSAIAIWIKPSGEISTILQAFSLWVQQSKVNADELSGGVLWDGLAAGFEQPIALDEQIHLIDIVHRLFERYPRFKTLCINTAIYHNSGANAVQELGYGMAALIEVLDGLTKKTTKAQALLSDVFFYIAVGSDYFMEIAKVKTFRILLHQLATLYGAHLDPEDLPLFAVTSRWSKSHHEPHNNLLRNTTEAMSAIIGGCNTLYVEPHDKYLQTPDPFSKRMARNISLILKEEAYFDKVLDPAAGSYLIENLILSLYGKTVHLLQDVEAEGGWWKSYIAHSLQEEIRVVRNKRFGELLQKESKEIDTTDDSHGPSRSSNKRPTEQGYQLKPISQFFPLETRL